MLSRAAQLPPRPAPLGSASLPSAGWLGLGVVLIVVAAVAAPNPILAILSVVAVIPVALLLWSRDQPPVLLASCAVQWLQVVTGVAYAQFSGVSIDQMFGVGQMTQAVTLSLTGIVVLAIGMRLGLVRYVAGLGARMATEVQRIVLARSFVAWLAAFLLGSVAVVASSIVPGLSQVIYALTALKWAFCFILAYAVLTRNAGYGLLCLAMLIEFVTGSLGFFAGFKEVFFMVFLAALCTPRRLTGRARALLVAAAIVVVTASLLWTAVKKEYRAYQAEATEGRPQKLVSLLVALDADDLNEAAEALIFRVEYLQYFAYTIEHVPDVVPYEGGALWTEAIAHVFMPRALFPDKPVLDDSARTMMYTGKWVAGADQGTSIGLGYMAESYVDFGPYGMFLPIFLLGVFFGTIYRHFANDNRSALLGCSIATAALFSTLQAFATSNTKIVGGTVMTCLMFLAFDRFASDRVMRWLTTSSASLPPIRTSESVGHA